MQTFSATCGLQAPRIALASQSRLSNNVPNVGRRCFVVRAIAAPDAPSVGIAKLKQSTQSVNKPHKVRLVKALTRCHSHAHMLASLVEVTLAITFPFTGVPRLIS